MNTFNLVILIIFISQLSIQFVYTIDKGRDGLMAWFAIEIMAFGYLAKFLFLT